MSRTYSQIGASAQKIIDMVGTSAYGGARLALTADSPKLPAVTLLDLVPSTIYERLDSAVSKRICIVIQRKTTSLGERFQQQYQQMAEQLYSSREFGLDDLDVESRLIRMFEDRYQRCLDDIRAMLCGLLASEVGRPVDNRNTRGGFGDHTLRILETAFSYTKSPLSTEIDHLSKLTSLEPHQVRTWFQNKRNRGNKPSANTKKQLRTASSSHVQSSTQLPIIDGRRVASLPSRKYAPPTRATRPLPRRNAPIQDVPLARTLSQESHESDGTTFSFSSIPSNGGFTGFSYPSIQPSQMVQQPTYNLDPLITATYSQPQLPIQQIYNPLIPQQIDQYNPYPYGDLNGYPTQPTQMSELDFESYLNLNIDNLAPPTEDLGYDLEAQIQAALRPSTSQFETLAPTMSPSESSPYSDFSNSWFNEFDFGMDGGNGDDVELLKVVLDGMSAGSSGGSPIVKTELYPGIGGGGRSESPETVASFALNSDHGSQRGGGSIQGGGSIRGEGEGGSGRQSPNAPGPSTSNSISNSDDLSFMFNFDLEPVSHDVQGGVYGQNAEASGSGSGWIGGVLPFDMGDQVMGTA